MYDFMTFSYKNHDPDSLERLGRYSAPYEILYITIYEHVRIWNRCRQKNLELLLQKMGGVNVLVRDLNPVGQPSWAGSGWPKFHLFGVRPKPWQTCEKRSSLHHRKATPVRRPMARRFPLANRFLIVFCLFVWFIWVCFWGKSPPSTVWTSDSWFQDLTQRLDDQVAVHPLHLPALSQLVDDQHCGQKLARYLCNTRRDLDVLLYQISGPMTS